MDAETQQDRIDFERQRNQLMQLSSQKQQIEFQTKLLKDALEELNKTKEEKVFKAVGNIMLQTPVEEVKKDLNKEIEGMELRLKTVKKQEEISVDKLNKLKKKIEGTQEKETKEEKK